MLLLTLIACYISDEEARARFDVDGDGHLPPIAGGDDCREGDDQSNPSAPEQCDGVDNDCDGLVDNDPVDGETWYLDRDGDGHGSTDATEACERPEDHVRNSNDCDDQDRSNSPSGKETCDEADNDCDGDIDEGLDTTPWFPDADSDGFGDQDLGVSACGAPDGLIDVGGDCDDADTNINPAALDIAYDGLDTDCDGQNDFDADGDGWVSELHPGTAGGTALGEGDCDDDNAGTNPGVVDTPYDGVDADCAGDNDFDADGDGFVRVGNDGEVDATAPFTGDCDDTDGNVNPGAVELIDGIDNDCSGADETADTDGDGLSDAFEIGAGTDYLLFDTDGGGKGDGAELSEGRDPLDDDDDRRWILLSAAGNDSAGHTCAINGDTLAAHCWGSDTTSQLQVPAEPGWIDLSTSGGQSCGVTTSEEALCWGQTFGVSTSPAVRIAAGSEHACSIRSSDGALECWGEALSGQLNAPAGPFDGLACAGDHCCAIRTNGSLACWGLDHQGQATPPSGSFTHVTTGADHSCGLDSSGVVVCWGSDADGRSSPPLGDGHLDVSAGHDFTCAIDNSDELVCWGNGESSKTSPPSGTFFAVAAGGPHACAIRTDGEIECWGAGVAETTPP